MIITEQNRKSFRSKDSREKRDTVHILIGRLYAMDTRNEDQIANDLALARSAYEMAIKSKDPNRACQFLEHKAKLECELTEARSINICWDRVFDAIESLDRVARSDDT